MTQEPSVSHDVVFYVNDKEIARGNTAISDSLHRKSGKRWGDIGVKSCTMCEGNGSYFSQRAGYEVLCPLCDGAGKLE